MKGSRASGASKVTRRASQRPPLRPLSALRLDARPRSSLSVITQGPRASSRRRMAPRLASEKVRATQGRCDRLKSAVSTKSEA